MKMLIKSVKQIKPHPTRWHDITPLITYLKDEDISGENKLTSGCEKNSSNQCGGVNDEEKFDEISSLKSLQKELDEMRVKAEFLEKALDDVENMRQITR